MAGRGDPPGQPDDIKRALRVRKSRFKAWLWQLLTVTLGKSLAISGLSFLSVQKEYRTDDP